MARDIITMLVNLRKCEISTSKNYGAYFYEVEPKEPLSLCAKGLIPDTSEKFLIPPNFIAFF